MGCAARAWLRTSGNVWLALARLRAGVLDHEWLRREIGELPPIATGNVPPILPNTATVRATVAVR